MHLLVAGKTHHRPGTFHSRHIGPWSEQRKASYLMAAQTGNHALGWGWNLMLLEMWRAVIYADMGLV
jgi:hypothetical protein